MAVSRSVNPAVTSFLYTPTTIGTFCLPALELDPDPPRRRGDGRGQQQFERVRIMLRFKVLFSVVPLLAAAVVARLELSAGPQPCIAVGSDAIRIATSPWHADLHVGFTDDPSLASIRVALTDSADTADFTIVDDTGEAEGSACAMTWAIRFVLIADSPPEGAPVIYLSQGGPAEYRIFVRSKRMTDREAAALIVGARSLPSRLAEASL